MMDYARIIARIPHERKYFPPRTALLKAGEVPQSYFFIEKGCARLWCDSDGRDITLHFFFEGEGAAITESLLKGTPSPFCIETVEACEVLVFPRDAMMEDLNSHADAAYSANSGVLETLFDYMDLLLSRIRDTPQQRYDALLAEHPEILRRVPLRHVASYLGITPVSLSRIRAREARQDL